MANLPAISPQKKRKKWVIPSLREGFSPDLLDGIWQPLANIAADLERSIVKHVAEQAANPNPNRPGLVRHLRRIINTAIGKMGRAATTVEKQATTLGERTAAQVLDQVPKAQLDKLVHSAPKAPRSTALGTTVRSPKSLHQAIKETGPHALGSGSHLYDETTRRLIANPVESDAARRRLAQDVLDDFQKRGVTGFVDKAGKRWNIVPYGEMATRTAAANLAMDAHLNEMKKVGLDVVRVTVMPNCHPWCQPYQGRLLSITGATTGEYHGEKIVTSVADAIAHGFRHPNCRHSVRVHIPGMESPDPDLIDPGDYKATQE